MPPKPSDSEAVKVLQFTGKVSLAEKEVLILYHYPLVNLQCKLVPCFG